MSNNSNYIQATENVQQICNKPYLYKITNQINNKFYYGVHNGTNPNYMGSGKLLHLAYEKHGIENFKKEILMWFDTMEEAYEYEAIVVTEKLINDPMCYNMKVGGFGGTTPCEETKQKLSEIWNNKTEEKKEEINQKLSEAATKRWEDMSPEDKEELSQKLSEIWNNKTEEKKEEIRQKQSEATIKNWENKPEEEKEEFRQQRRGENNPMFGKNAFANKSAEEMAVINQKKRVACKRKYYCPYDQSIQRDARNMVQYIKKNYPNEQQWMDYTKEEKESYLVVLQDDAGLIAN